jgi:hypothetical protein
MKSNWHGLDVEGKRKTAPTPNAQHCWDARAYCSIVHPKGTPHQVDRWAAGNAYALEDYDAYDRIMAAVDAHRSE